MEMSVDPNHAYEEGDDLEPSDDDDFVSFFSSERKHRPHPMYKEDRRKTVASSLSMPRATYFGRTAMLGGLIPQLQI
jgi:hypothetical protein